jgi:hypothetical protein
MPLNDPDQLQTDEVQKGRLNLLNGSHLTRHGLGGFGMLGEVWGNLGCGLEGWGVAVGLDGLGSGFGSVFWGVSGSVWGGLGGGFRRFVERFSFTFCGVSNRIKKQSKATKNRIKPINHIRSFYLGCASEMVTFFCCLTETT